MAAGGRGTFLTYARAPTSNGHFIVDDAALWTRDLDAYLGRLAPEWPRPPGAASGSWDLGEARGGRRPAHGTWARERTAASAQSLWMAWRCRRFRFRSASGSAVGKFAPRTTSPGSRIEKSPPSVSAFAGR